ncbi:MAG: voltage-gated chloride channel family protein [Bacteroidia bacterium]
MIKIKTSFEHIHIAKHLVKWTLLVIPVSLLVGSIIALFLWLLDLVTQIRWQNEWLLFFLPVAGIIIYFLYKYSGKNAEAGNNLIMDEIHKPGGGVPARMAPLVLITTVITHLFGGSAGREGTAVQIGGGMASFLAKLFKLNKEDVRILLMTGVAAGFGAVFGTPLTGAIFALEVLAIGRIQYNALIPCLIASILASITCSAWGIQHTHYHIDYNGSATQLFSFIHFDVILLLKVIIAGVAFGLVSYLFAELSHTLKNYSNKFISKKWLIPILGGIVVITLTYIIGTRDYLGLGVSAKETAGVSILSAFNIGGTTYWSWFWKLLFTVITLSTGFKGGEVTPLFFIGAALGNTLSVLMGAPVDLFAGLGLIAVFAGATNTPIACTLMGVELFGSNNLIYYAVACFGAYYFSGHSGIYQSQRVAVSKINSSEHNEQTLKQIREKRLNK